ncbi:hypothetical protein RJ639_031263 [Escallonia herrerae]|uniref:Uncharacterized protein n=1 Tax=Escallonia herrerae TaxID=1293975 RepID=A0AA88WXW8_9ASTE|nr:hypothetical protein RJ639_031263 [Escallonia herrerae]
MNKSSTIAETSVIQGFKQLNIDDTVEFTDNISEAFQAQEECSDPSCCQTSSLPHLTKAINALRIDYEDGFENFEAEAKMSVSEKIDALERPNLQVVKKTQTEYVDVVLVLDVQDWA